VFLGHLKKRKKTQTQNLQINGENKIDKFTKIEKKEANKLGGL
jgi:hypothetical protein